MIRAIAIVLTFVVALLPATACFDDDEPKAVFDSTVAAEVECRTVPTKFNGKLTLVRAAIDGEDLGWFVLESATSYLLVDSRKIDVTDREEVGKGSFPRPCRTPVVFYQVDAFTVGPLTIANAYVGSADLSMLEDAVGEPIAGVIGFSVFKRAVVEMDFLANDGQGRVAIHNPLNYELESGEWKPVRIAGYQMVVPGAFERAVKGAFVVDTGYAGNVAIFSAFAANKKLLEDRVVVEKPALTMCGGATDLETRINKFTFAGKTFENPLVSFMQAGAATDVNSGRLGGVVGRGFLSKFVMIADVPNGRIAFIEHGDEAKEPM
jgi:hypothetical protein